MLCRPSHKFDYHYFLFFSILPACRVCLKEQLSIFTTHAGHVGVTKSSQKLPWPLSSLEWASHALAGMQLNHYCYLTATCVTCASYVFGTYTAWIVIPHLLSIHQCILVNARRFLYNSYYIYTLIDNKHIYDGQNNHVYIWVFTCM